MNNFVKLITEHPGLPEAHKSGEITILKNTKKECFLPDWSNMYKLDHPNRPTLDELSQWNSGFGRLLHEYPDGTYPLIVDIDSEPEVAEIIAGYFFENQVLSEHACIIKTAAGKSMYVHLNS